MCRFSSRSLSQHLNEWNDIEASPTVIDWISHGVKLPLDKEPDSFELSNYTLSTKYCEFIDTEISSLLLAGAIDICEQKPKCISPINCVPKKSGKLRLVIDLRKLNSYIHVQSCQNESISTVKELIRPKDRLFSVDLKQGYLHIPVHRDYTDYLGFQWRGTFYKYLALPFGLCCSNFFFVKCIRPVIAYLRRLGVRITVFIDDFLILVQVDEAHTVKDLVISTLLKLGWCINWEKSQLLLSQNITYIGYVIDTSGDFPTLCIAKDKIRKLRKDIARAIKVSHMTARVLARITGTCISMTKAVVPGKLFLRNVYRVLAKRQGWDDIVHLDSPAIKDLSWWLDALGPEGWNLEPLQVRPIDIQIQTDASHTGWGASLGTLRAAGYWDHTTSIQSSNYREMLAVLMALKTFAPNIQGKSVQIQTDNTSTVAYINYMGGPSPQLTEMAKSIWAEAYAIEVHLQATHLAGRLNVTADELSRISDNYEWMLHPRLFQFIDRVMGPHTIDRFAAFHNAQLTIYNTRFLDPGSSGIDALAQQDWANHMNFVNAPFRLIPQVLNLVQQQQADATIIAPWWPAMTWFRTLQEMTVQPPLRIPSSPNAMWQVGEKVPEPLRNVRWKIYAWSISGRRT